MQLIKGTVYKSTGSWHAVKSEENLFFQCRLKGKIRTQELKSTNPIAVGDVVYFEIIKESEGVIVQIEKRQNYLIRKSVNLSKKTHILAANIDQLLLVVTIKEPITHLNFIDRILTCAEAYRIKTTLIFNKIDLNTASDGLHLKEIKTIYEKIGYCCLETSVLECSSIEALKHQMMGKTNLFTGHSGVGKSSLINAIDPSLHLKTKPISAQFLQGQHTTTFSQIYDMSFDAKIIDSPGIKGFGMVALEKSELKGYFPEFITYNNLCKYQNCLHQSEPKCEIKKAVLEKKISNSRYNSYLQILQGDESQYRSDYFKDKS